MFRRGQIMVALGLLVVVGVLVFVFGTNGGEKPDTREQIVFWGSNNLGEDVYTLIRRFEQKNPRYRVVMGTAAARDIVGDAQRLLCATAGGVPPDVVWFDRFAIGEWASRGALTNLTPLIDAQAKNDPYRIDLGQFYDFTIQEASYKRPGSDDAAGLFGVPTTADCRVLFTNGDLMRQEGLVDATGEPVTPQNWEQLHDYAIRLTRYANPQGKGGEIKRLGFAPNFGNSWLYMFAWEAGGELMDPTRTRVTMDSPPVVRALRFMTDIYDDLGGFKQVDSFKDTFQGAGLDPFIKGQVAMKIDTSNFMNAIADWKREMDFIVTPAPMPADQLANGREPITWAGGFALVIPTTAKNKAGAFKLMQYLYSWEGVQQLQEGKREQKEAEGRLFLPEGLANRVFNERLVEETIAHNPNVPPRFRQAYAVVKELMPRTLIRPVTPVGQLLWGQHIRAYEAAVNHTLRDEARAAHEDEIKYCLSRMAVDVQRELDQILSPPPPNVVNFKPYLIGYAILLGLPFAAMFGVYKGRRREHGYKAREVGAAMVFASPWLIGFAVFVGGPILFSILFSFTRYDVLSPARYVGWGNYAEIFKDPVFYKSLWNTVVMILRIPLGMAVSLGIALLLNNAVRAIGIYRTGFYLPAIMPLVAASLMWIWIFNPQQGLLNDVLGWLFALPPMHWLESLFNFHFTLPLWLKDPNWSKPAMILMSLWTAGGGMIIWLAGLQSIPQQLYEAASIDGANAWHRFRHITIPMLSPYILFNLVIGLIGTMQIFAEAYIMTEGGPADSTLFYAYYLFRQAFQFFRMGYAAALAWILFVIVLALTLLQLWLSKRWVHYDQS